MSYELTWNTNDFFKLKTGIEIEYEDKNDVHTIHACIFRTHYRMSFELFDVYV